MDRCQFWDWIWKGIFLHYSTELKVQIAALQMWLRVKQNIIMIALLRDILKTREGDLSQWLGLESWNAHFCLLINSWITCVEDSEKHLSQGPPDSALISMDTDLSLPVSGYLGWLIGFTMWKPSRWDHHSDQVSGKEAPAGSLERVNVFLFIWIGGGGEVASFALCWIWPFLLKTKKS